MKPKLYIETSIISYLTSRPSRNIITAARQELTRQWWSQERENFDIFISEFVLSEAKEGDPTAAKLRNEALSDLPSVELLEEIRILAKSLIDPGPIPQKAALGRFSYRFCCLRRC